MGDLVALRSQYMICEHQAKDFCHFDLTLLSTV